MPLSFLVLNGGSSTTKFALFHAESLECLSSGVVEEVGVFDPIREAVGEKTDLKDIQAVGHRIVHGGTEFSAPTLLTEDVLEKLEKLSTLAPEHVPRQLNLVRSALQAFPEALQVGCFDTAFHRTMPSRAKCVALPRDLTDKHQVQRFGFHGLSYAFILQELQKISSEEADGRLVVCHLGHGASMAAVKGGECHRRRWGSVLQVEL